MLKKILRGFFFSTKIETAKIIFFILLWTALLFACSGQSVQKVTKTPSPEIIYTAYPSNLIGEIINIDGCIRIRSLDNNKSSAIVWTPDTSASIEGDQIRIITGIVRKDTSEIVFNFGDIVKIGGGESAFPDEELLKRLPPNCDGPYWIIGWSITAFQSTEEP